MLEFTNKGIIYSNYLYEISKSDMEWIKEENKKQPYLHPARNLRSLAHTVYEVE